MCDLSHNINRGKVTVGNKRELTINMAASLIQFTINIGIGFCLSPFVVSKLGAEAYGYVGLANNIILWRDDS